MIMQDNILGSIDHTQLNVTATWENIVQLCDEAIRYHTATVCIPPCYIAKAKEYVGERLTLCTVIGFPNGYQTSAVKCFEAKDALENGADELDMVVNITDIKNQAWDNILQEIRAIKDVCGHHILKVIIETCYLTDAEKIKMCQLVTEAGAEFIKTSTGFGSAGATMEDILLFRQHLGVGVRIKAAGGIKTLAQAEDFLRIGVSRLGSSSLVSLIHNADE